MWLLSQHNPCSWHILSAHHTKVLSVNFHNDDEDDDVDAHDDEDDVDAHYDEDDVDTYDDEDDDVDAVGKYEG